MKRIAVLFNHIHFDCHRENLRKEHKIMGEEIVTALGLENSIRYCWEIGKSFVF